MFKQFHDRQGRLVQSERHQGHFRAVVRIQREKDLLPEHGGAWYYADLFAMHHHSEVLQDRVALPGILICSRSLSETERGHHDADPEMFLRLWAESMLISEVK